ncbi:MAG: hypothetical protein P1S60_20945, partial [Anaerolineae bacterium]|nr:hypothetical protein [Anaerolineae bacterium]
MGKTTLMQTCLGRARKNRWQDLSVNWCKNTPHSFGELLDRLAQNLATLSNERAILRVNEQVSQAYRLERSIKRFRSDNPEIWQSMLHKANSENDHQNQDIEHRARYHLVNYMFGEKRFPLGLDIRIAQDPVLLIARAVMEAIVQTAGRRGLVVELDGCEALSPSLENLLRDEIICAASQHNARIIFILSSTMNQYHQRTVVDIFGNVHTVKGYADYLYNPPPLVWVTRRWVDPEVRDYLQSHKWDNSDASIETLQQQSRGIPILAELITSSTSHLDGDFSYDIPAHYPGVDDDALIRQVTAQFIERGIGESEKKVLFAIALFQDPEPTSLSAAGGFPPDVLTDILDQLRSKLPYVH